jgi:hypothetical protein
MAACRVESVEHTVRVTGIFSDMTYNQEGGDVLGTEIFIVLSNQGYFAVYQFSEGEPAPPVVVKAAVTGSAVTFSLPGEAGARGEFRGTVTDTELVGSFGKSSQTIRLKRKNSYWQ